MGVRRLLEERWSWPGVVILALVLGLAPTPRVAARSLAAFEGGASAVLSGGPSQLPVEAQAAISAALGREDSAYHATASGGGLEARNWKHGLATEFTLGGVEVRTVGLRWRLELRGHGYGDVLHAVAKVAPSPHGNRVEYARGVLTEWYVNGPLGLEQGFTLQCPPSRRRDGPLTLELALSGDLAPAAGPGSRAVTLKGKDGQPVLRYTGLVAHDVDGRELPAWLDVQSERLLLRVDDAGAQYPVVVDPLVQDAKLTASDGGPFDLLGTSVAIDGDTVVVGSGSRGSYVFVRPTSGWASASETAKLTASDGPSGRSVAISGNTIVVGGAEAAYVFVKPMGGWVNATETAKLGEMPAHGPGSLSLSCLTYRSNRSSRASHA
jgi:hypothetical protein